MADEYEPLREALKGTPVEVTFQSWTSRNGVCQVRKAIPHGDIEGGMAAYKWVAGQALHADPKVFVWLSAIGSTVPHIIIDADKDNYNERTVRWWLERVAEANAVYDANLSKEALPLVRRLLAEHEQRAIGSGQWK